jgi:hypothetical protein
VTLLPFTLEWLGGPAEYHFRKARPDDDFDWDSLSAADYPASFIVAAREVWMGVVIAEYAAIASFSAVVSAMTAARAPLDLIGMTADFLADEVRHVELASRLVMQLGGAPTKQVDTERLAPVLPPELTPFQRSNELALRVGCIAEVFASATATPMMRATTHPLVRNVDERILRDEARHRRFGSLYFEWAANYLDHAEQTRLGAVAIDALGTYAALWRNKAPEVSQEGWNGLQGHELGWFERARYVPLAKSAVQAEILPPLRDLGLVLPQAGIDALFAD